MSRLTNMEEQNMTMKDFALRLMMAGGLTASAASAQAAGPRFEPLTPDRMTPAQRAQPSIAAAIEAGRYNPSGYDAVMLRNPGLAGALGAVAAKVYPGFPAAGTDAPPTLSKGLAEIAILYLAHEWDFPAMFGSHGPAAIKAGVSQPIVDALAKGRRPAAMSADQAAVYDFCSELIRTHRVGDGAFARLREHLSEREVVDLVALMGTYTNSLMILKVADIDRH